MPRPNKKTVGKASSRHSARVKAGKGNSKNSARQRPSKSPTRKPARVRAPPRPPSRSRQTGQLSAEPRKTKARAAPPAAARPPSKQPSAGRANTAVHAAAVVAPSVTPRQAAARIAAGARNRSQGGGQRKRGWRDIEAMSERARLKKQLVDIWHEDIELEEDIFGESDIWTRYYAAGREEEVVVDPEIGEEFEEFEEEE